MFWETEEGLPHPHRPAVLHSGSTGVTDSPARDTGKAWGATGAKGSQKLPPIIWPTGWPPPPSPAVKEDGEGAH